MATRQEPNSSSLRRSVSDSDQRRRRQCRRSTISTTSSKSSWSSKLVKLLTRLALFSRDSDLTEESLEAHNKRINDLDDKTPKSSPYYRGLTDSSLAVNYHYGPLATHVSTGGPHHYANSATTTLTHASLSSVVLSKLKEWTPCLLGTSNTKPPRQHKAPIPTVTTTTTIAAKTAPSSSSLQPHNAAKAAAELKREEIGSWVRESEEKLLRERLLYGRRRVGGAAVGEAEKERYTWGDKYRPKVLEDFICNRKTACELKEVVRERGCGHYIFEGPPGVGKRTMIQAMLVEAFGKQAMEVYCQYDFYKPLSPHVISSFHKNTCINNVYFITNYYPSKSECKIVNYLVILS